MSDDGTRIDDLAATLREDAARLREEASRLAIEASRMREGIVIEWTQEAKRIHERIASHDTRHSNTFKEVRERLGVAEGHIVDFRIFRGQIVAVVLVLSTLGSLLGGFLGGLVRDRAAVVAATK